MGITPYNRATVTPGYARRAKYHNDEEYRERVKNSSRRTYRRKNNVELDTCLHSLGFVEDMAKQGQVKTPSGVILDCKTLNVSRTAGALQVMYQTVLRWIKTGMLPKPILASVSRQHQVLYVYHVDEVRVFIEELGKHKRTVRYYRHEHSDVKDAIITRIEALRRDLNLVEA